MLKIDGLRIKKFKACKNLLTLRSDIIHELKVGEILNVYLDEEKEQFFSVEKHTMPNYFVLKTEDELIGLPKYHSDELLYIFEEILDKNLSDIEVFDVEVVKLC